MGEEEVKKEDVGYLVAGELGWFTMSEVRKALDIAEKRGLVAMEDDMVKPLFDFRSVDIPLGFQADKKILEADTKKDTFQILLNKILDASEMDRQELMAKVNEVQNRMNVEIKTALLITADEEDIDLTNKKDMIKRVRDYLLQASSE